MLQMLLWYLKTLICYGKNSFYSQRRQQNSPSQLDGTLVDFVTSNGNQEIQKENELLVKSDNFVSCIMNLLVPVSGTQVELETFQQNNTNRLRNEVNNVEATVESRTHDAFLAAMDNLVALQLKLP